MLRETLIIDRLYYQTSEASLNTDQLVTDKKSMSYSVEASYPHRQYLYKRALKKNLKCP
ncbi:hypothetical protein QE439_003738 [Pedobacter agri]|nr:hypothetical protein [Pedobacter agri]